MVSFSYAAAVGLLIATHLVNNVSAHTRFAYPTPRSPRSDLKNGPCGLIPRGASTTALAPGPLTLVLEETITHRGAPWRVALSDDGTDTGFETCILLDHIPHPGLSPGLTSSFFRITVNIPDVQCAQCTLQILSAMTDKIGATPGIKCTYDPLNTVAPMPNCFSNYHTCADISISGTVPRAQAVCAERADWPWKTGSEVAGVITNEKVLPRVYYRETAQWCPDGYLRDVPAAFKTPVGPGVNIGAPGVVVPTPTNAGGCAAANPPLTPEVQAGATTSAPVGGGPVLTTSAPVGGGPILTTSAPVAATLTTEAPVAEGFITAAPTNSDGIPSTGSPVARGQVGVGNDISPTVSPASPASGMDMTLLVGGSAGVLAVGAGMFVMMRRQDSKSAQQWGQQSTMNSNSIPGAGLPAGWTRSSDPISGKTYYYNASGETQWHAPNGANL